MINALGLTHSSEHKRLALLLRGKITNWLFRNRYSKSNSIEKLVGCTKKQFKSHIESGLLPGMNTKNYGKGINGGWSICHKIPCAAFNLEDPDQQLICFNYRNLRPEWEKTNRSNGYRIFPKQK